MPYFLVKSEPDAYSWDQLVADGKTDWTGVRNAAARLHLLAMQKGDLVLYYHSNEGKEVVGLARVTKPAYPDPTAADPRWVAVELAPVKPLKKSVTLAEMKAVPKLKNMPLIRIARLSVMPLTDDEFTTVLEMGQSLILLKK